LQDIAVTKYNTLWITTISDKKTKICCSAL